MSVAAIGPAMMGVQAVTGLMGASAKAKAGKQEEAALNAKAAHSEYMAGVYRANAIDDANELIRQTAQVKGAQQAEFAGGGVGYSGTVMQVLQDTAQRGAYSVEKVMFGGELNSYNANLDAFNYRFAAKESAKAGKQAGIMGILSTGLKIGSTYMSSRPGGLNPINPDADTLGTGDY
jgi:hypothetical protein